MTPFKFFRGDPYSDRTINTNYYRVVEVRARQTGQQMEEQQPIKMAVINAVNICHRFNHNYQDYEHYFDVEGRDMKLKILDITRYRNPEYIFFKIRYKMSPSDMNLNESNVINQLRLDEPDYYRQILDRRRG